jgi:hypothetical protein
MVYLTDEQINRKLDVLARTFSGVLAVTRNMLPERERDEVLLVASTEWPDLRDWLTAPPPAGNGVPADAVCDEKVLLCPARQGDAPVATIHMVALRRSRCAGLASLFGCAALAECPAGMFQVLFVGQGYTGLMALSPVVVAG